MNRGRSGYHLHAGRVPRTHGDEPWLAPCEYLSPDVFPVPTGMNRALLGIDEPILSVPRTHGDEPRDEVKGLPEIGCSPYPRG